MKFVFPIVKDQKELYQMQSKGVWSIWIEYEIKLEEVFSEENFSFFLDLRGHFEETFIIPRYIY